MLGILMLECAVRKQAMKEVGISRRRRGNYSSGHSRQFEALGNTLPITSELVEPGSSDASQDGSVPSDAESSESSRTSDKTEFNEMVPKSFITTRRSWPIVVDCADEAFPLTALNLLGDYEAARSKFHVDIADLSILTNFNVGKGAIAVLSANPTRIADLLGHTRWYGSP